MNTDKNSKPIHSNHRERMRTRFQENGSDGFETHELLEMFLYDSIPRLNTNQTAHMLLDRFGSLYGVFTANESELCTIKGVGPKTACYIKEWWRSTCRKNEEKLRSCPMVSFESISNFLIWHRFMSDSDLRASLVLLDENMFITNIYDIMTSEEGTDGSDESVLAKNFDELPEETYAGAKNALLGVFDRDARDDAAFLESKGILLKDVIYVDGFNAESMLERG